MRESARATGTRASRRCRNRSGSIPFYSAPYIVLGTGLLQKGQLATAEGMLKRAIEYDPNNRAAHYLLGQLYQRSGRADDAKRELAIAERLQGQPGR